MSTDETSPAKSARTYFRQTERDDATAKQIRKNERAAESAKIANLRRLRLEREAAERDATDKSLSENGEQPAKPARRKAARKRAAVRMIY